jgi:hypothetical protein
MSLANKIKTTERRGHVRHKCEANIECSFFNKEFFLDAKLLNFSQGGVYFETAQNLKPGATISLDMKMIPSSKISSMNHERPRSVSLGEVKWRSDLSASDHSYYGVGVGYPFPN